MGDLVGVSPNPLVQYQCMRFCVHFCVHFYGDVYNAEICNVGRQKLNQVRQIAIAMLILLVSFPFCLLVVANVQSFRQPSCCKIMRQLGFKDHVWHTMLIFFILKKSGTSMYKTSELSSTADFCENPKLLTQYQLKLCTNFLTGRSQGSAGKSYFFDSYGDVYNAAT